MITTTVNAHTAIDLLHCVQKTSQTFLIVTSKRIIGF